MNGRKLIPVPSQSLDRLDSFLGGLKIKPGPQGTARAIVRGLVKGFDYGCDDNLSMGLWRRYPHQIGKLVNCEDGGSFAFFAAARAGLDVSLIEFENLRGMRQKHSSVLLRGSREDYVFDKGISIEFKGIESGNIGGDSFSSARLLSLEEVAERIEYSQREETLFNFLQDGQVMQSHYFLNRFSKLNLLAKVSRSFRANGEKIWVMKSFELPGMYLSLVNRRDICVSKGLDNLKMIEPVHLGYFTEDKEGHQVDMDDAMKKVLNVRYLLAASLNEATVYERMCHGKTKKQIEKFHQLIPKGSEELVRFMMEFSRKFLVKPFANHVKTRMIPEVEPKRMEKVQFYLSRLLVDLSHNEYLTPAGKKQVDLAEKIARDYELLFR